MKGLRLRIHNRYVSKSANYKLPRIRPKSGRRFSDKSDAQTRSQLDDGRWEIDDAVHQDGGEYDLELDANSYAILKRERDD